MSVKEKSSQQISGRLQEGQQENTKTILIPYEQINSFYCKNSVKMDYIGDQTVRQPVLEYKCSLVDSDFSKEEIIQLFEFYLQHPLSDEEIQKEKLTKHKWLQKDKKIATRSLFSEIQKTLDCEMVFASYLSDEIIHEIGLQKDEILSIYKPDVPRIALALNFNNPSTRVNGKMELEITVKKCETMLQCFFRHIRNAIAHNNTYFLQNGMLLLLDYDKQSKITAFMLIRKMDLFKIIHLVERKEK